MHPVDVSDKNTRKELRNKVTHVYNKEELPRSRFDRKALLQELGDLLQHLWRSYTDRKRKNS